jgi:DNA repair exonuclease SbcCD ATPase subunit
MRLISLTIRNYRIHRETHIDFDASRHLIGGVNETGKSTIAEAIHRVLFMRHKAGGEIQKSMVSDIHAGHPEVKLVLEAAGDTWTIEKTFAGPTRSTARLSSLRGISLQGDAAEDKLAELTSNPDGPANRENELNTRWAHLWVWQGKSGENAATHAATHRSELTQRLQESGLASVMQSDTDEKIREKIRALHDEMFTANGKPKANSRLDITARSVEEATRKLDEASDQKSRLEDAVKNQEASTQDLKDCEAKLPGHRTSLEEHKTALAKADQMGTELEDKKKLHSQAELALRNLKKIDEDIRNLQSQIESDQKKLEPEEKKLTALAEQASTASAKANTARNAADTTSEDLRHARQLHDLAIACVAQFEKALVHDALLEKQVEIDEIQKSLSDDQSKLDRLPSISEEQRKNLRKLESELREARSALDAIATGIELVASPQSVSLNGQLLKPTECQVVTQASEISLPDGTRLRILPGGGISLENARSKAEDFAKKVKDLLSRLALTDSTRVEEIFVERQALEHKINNTQSRLEDFGASDLPKRLFAAKSALDSAKEQANRRQATLSPCHPVTMPGTLDEAIAWQEKTRKSTLSKEDTERKLNSEAKAAAEDSQKKATDHEKARKAVQTLQSQLEGTKATANSYEKTHGDATKRAADIKSASDAEALAKGALDKAESALAALNPKSCEREIERLTRVISNLEEKQQKARECLAVAENTLVSEGTSDPEADLLQAKARRATASEEHAREKRHADAIALLYRLFTESRESITRSVTQPIADRVTGYLECLFGRGVRVDVDWSQTDSKPTQTIHLQHPGMPRFAFDSLSGGAKEQVAAAVRLATAEILAAAHNDCLPILFDDSFAYSDRERIQSLQSMLDLAATRGLQVIVLSCTPADYVGFGAKATQLEKPRFTGVIPLGKIDESSTESNPKAEAGTDPVDPELAETFLSALREAGGSSGNTSLQKALGWDNATYYAVKESLVATGQITKGQGRGGSVALL